MRQMLAIGDFVFSVYQDTDYEQFVRTAEGGYTPMDRGGQAPSTQRTGRPLQTIQISGQILGNGGGGTLDRLRALVDAGPQVVVRGSGEILGQWVVTRVTETAGRLIDDGTALKTTFSVDLREYQA